jgi:hypothetical protein
MLRRISTELKDIRGDLGKFNHIYLGPVNPRILIGERGTSILKHKPLDPSIFGIKSIEREFADSFER